jgi:hypothetical protein
MKNDDEAVRKARAEALRRKIAQLTNPDQDEADRDSPHESSEGAKNSSPESPRHFVERRMRELDKERTD